MKKREIAAPPPDLAGRMARNDRLGRVGDQRGLKTRVENCGVAARAPGGSGRRPDTHQVRSGWGCLDSRFRGNDRLRYTMEGQMGQIYSRPP